MSHGESHQDMNEAGMFLMKQSSGTAFQPSSWPMPMLMSRAAGWSMMWMGQAFVVSTQQGGPRGGDKVYSPNWGMLGAFHKLGSGSLMLRAMVSLDPLTITDRRYPLLFQTGETAYRRPLVDAQHPHDLLMELAIQYAHPLGERAMANLYYAPVGEIALGPVAYPHRASAFEIPQAALGHHWEDSTHIANNVITGGLSVGKVRLEASGFRGQEPNENRWNIDMASMDSWSTRLTVAPAANWMAQASVGRLTHPEELHPGDVVRATASLHYIRPVSHRNYWASSLIWARNYKTDGKYGSHAVLAETLVPLSRRNYLTGRFEWSQRDELFEYDHELAEEVSERTGRHAFPVTAYTVGYTRDIGLFPKVQTGLGANITAYGLDHVLKPYYGDRPWGVNVFLRVRLRASE